MHGVCAWCAACEVARAVRVEPAYGEWRECDAQGGASVKEEGGGPSGRNEASYIVYALELLG